MIDELDIQTYLFASQTEFKIYLFDTNNLTNLYKKEMIYINETDFKDPIINIISNVTANPLSKSEEIKKYLIEQIENPVRWRESITNMIDLGVNKFIEMGPGKVLSGLVKRIDRNVQLNQVNDLSDIKNLIND